MLLFSKMPPYFELKLELYSFLLSDQSMVCLIKHMSKIISSFRLVAPHDLYKEQSHYLRQSGRGLPKGSGITLTRS